MAKETAFLDAAVRLLAEKALQAAGGPRQLFLRADVDRDSSLSLRELAGACDRAGVALNDAELAALLVRFDTRGVGALDYADFAAAVAGIDAADARREPLERADLALSAALAAAARQGVAREAPAVVGVGPLPSTAAAYGARPVVVATTPARDARVTLAPAPTVDRLRRVVAARHRSPADAFAAYQDRQASPYLSVHELHAGLARDGMDVSPQTLLAALQQLLPPHRWPVLPASLLSLEDFCRIAAPVEAGFMPPPLPAVVAPPPYGTVLGYNAGAAAAADARRRRQLQLSSAYTAAAAAAAASDGGPYATYAPGHGEGPWRAHDHLLHAGAAGAPSRRPPVQLPQPTPPIVVLQPQAVAPAAESDALPLPSYGVTPGGVRYETAQQQRRPSTASVTVPPTASHRQQLVYPFNEPASTNATTATAAAPAVARRVGAGVPEPRWEQLLAVVARAVRSSTTSTTPAAASAVRDTWRRLAGAASPGLVPPPRGVSPADLRVGMAALGVPLTAAEAAALVDGFDANRDGQLDLAEWRALVGAGSSASDGWGGAGDVW